MFRKVIRSVVPFRVRHILWSLTPSIFRINTLVKTNLVYTESISLLPTGYYLREICKSDSDRLKTFYEQISPTAFKRKIPKRLESENCRGFAIFENAQDTIAYNNWLIHGYEKYLIEFGIDIKRPMIFWDSAYCLPAHRHQGFHEIMEQELINYTIKHGCKYFYMQIHTDNIKGNTYALSKGYDLVKTSYAIYWPIFDIYRSLGAFIKSPFKKIRV